MKLMTITAALAVALLGALPLAVEAQAAPTTQAGVATAPGAVAGAHTATVSAKVTAIDPAQRTITLQTASGKTRTVEAGDQVRNFDQIKVGDTVHARYTQALALEIRKGADTLPAPTEEHAVTAPPAPGAKPGGTVARKVTATAEVVAVNHAKHLVTLRGPGGNEVDVEAEDPAQLQNIKKGDHVQVTYVEALAISVQEAPAGK
ncbi:MAG TPA: hypothetical protein VMT66_17990 [Steroidobacteraceae bacterium]|nr:hypothetical protein [Steroidobacteraceae bacterium]